MKSDPSPLDQEPITWKSSDKPPWLDIGGSRVWFPVASSITIRGRECRTTSSFFDEVTRALSPLSSEVPRTWEEFIPWFCGVLDGDLGTTYYAVEVLDGEVMFLDEGNNYAREMGRFLHIFVKMNKDEDLRGWASPSRVWLRLHCLLVPGMVELFEEKVMEGLAEAF